MTFAVLIAIEAYQSSDSVKAILLASGPIGLIGSLFIIPIVLALRRATTRFAAEVSLLGATGFAIAAIFHNSLICYVVGVSLGLFSAMVTIPLHTHWIRRNFPTKSRGRLFSVGMGIRAGSSIVFSLGAGYALERDITSYPWILAAFAICGALSALAMSRVPQPTMAPRGRAGVFQAMTWVRHDRMFRWMLISFMIMGSGVLTMNSLRVEYVANDRYGLGFSETRVALLTSTIPALTRLATTFIWGWVFDRVHFIAMRMTMNGIFALALFLYFWGTQFWVIALGAVVFGMARGGGEIFWNLWVTKLAPPDRVAEYMSAHTFLTGIRGVAAPFVGFWAITAFSPRGATILALGCIAAATIVLLPTLRSARVSTLRA